MTPAALPWFSRWLSSRRYRRNLIACLATLGISATLLGGVLFVRWRADHALRNDTRVVLTQAKEQLIRALHSRRGTLTLLRDTVDKAPGLALAERVAMAKSGVAHTRHLLGIGFVRANETMTWWSRPVRTSSQERAHIRQAVAQRTALRNVWQVPSTFNVWPQSDRPLLVMLEPLKASANQRSGIVGLFDLTPLLADFFELTLQQPFPVQLAEGDRLLYRSTRWEPPTDTRHPLISEHPIRLDALRWSFQMQPGTTQTAQTMSWLNIVVVLLSAMAGLVTIGIIWLLAMRTRILQRAVSRRTAALRRTTERLRQLATTDELTGLFNRRFFLERWQREFERAKRYTRPLACLVIDVNGFKRVNDTLGHLLGDLVLKQVAQELKLQLRQTDILARFGGDEFVIALPETSVEQATLVAEKLREVPIEGTWSHQHRLGPVRLSVGLSYLQSDETSQEVIRRADAAMYASRRAMQRAAGRAPAPSKTTRRDSSLAPVAP